VYWICLIVGGGLLIISSLAGGDTDVGADVDVDVDLDTAPDVGHAHAASLASWFSMQFVVFFMAVFGLIGVTMTHLADQTSGLTLVSALVGGLVVGQGVHQLLQKLRRSSGDSTPKPQDYVDKLARVTITVTAGKPGEVAFRVGRAERFVPAVSKHTDQTFNPGEQVGVVDYRSGVVDVVSREEFDFTTKKG
jgi:hypothetical protein